MEIFAPTSILRSGRGTSVRQCVKAILTMDGFTRGQHPGSNIPDSKQRSPLSGQVGTADRRRWHEWLGRFRHRTLWHTHFQTREAEKYGEEKNRGRRFRCVRQLFHIYAAVAVFLPIALRTAFWLFRIGGFSCGPAGKKCRFFNETNSHRRS